MGHEQSTELRGEAIIAPITLIHFPLDLTLRSNDRGRRSQTGKEEKEAKGKAGRRICLDEKIYRRTTLKDHCSSAQEKGLLSFLDL